MEREARTQFDPGAAAADISGVLTALAGVTVLGSTIDIRLESAEPLQSLAAEVTSQTRTLAKDTLEARAEVVGVEDPAIEKARQPIERMPLGDADQSTVLGSVRDVKSGEGVRGGHVIATTADGQTVGEAAVDAMGNFAIELTGNPTEVRIEALDPEGKSVSVSTVELDEEEPAAHFIEMVSTGGKKTSKDHVDSSKAKADFGGVEVETTKFERSTDIRRLRELAMHASNAAESRKE